MVRRELLAEIGGFEESFTGSLQMYEDQAFLAKAYLATTVWFSSRCWLFYRQHADSCVSENMSAGKYHQIRRHFLEWFEAYLKAKGISDPAVRNAVGRAQLPYRYPWLFEVKSRATSEATHLVHGVRRRIRKAIASSRT
jgi:hypothetical protein